MPAHRRPRRAFLRQTATIAVGLAGVALLAACGSTAATGAGASLTPASKPVDTAGPAARTRSTSRGAASTAAAVTSATAEVPASATKAPAATGKTVIYYNFFAPADPQSQVLPHAAAAFGELERGTNVESDVVPGGAEKLEAKLEVLLAGGTPPDVSALNPTIITPLYSKGVLADLSPFIRRDAATFDPSDFNPQTLTRVTKQGKQYAVPLQMGLYVLVYNQALFDAASVAYPDDRWHWQTDFLEAAQKLTVPSKQQFGCVQPPMYAPIWANGGSDFSEDGKTCLLDRPAAVDALQWLSDLTFKYKVAPRPADLANTSVNQLFEAGRLAMNVTITGSVSQYERDKLRFTWDIAHVPLGTQGRATIVQGPSLAVFQASPRQELAWQWVAYYTGKENQKYAAEVGHVVSARKSAAAAYEALPPPPAHRAPMVDSVAFSRQPLFLANWAQVNDVMTKDLDDTLTLGNKSAQEAGQQACRDVTPLLQ